MQYEQTQQFGTEKNIKQVIHNETPTEDSKLIKREKKSTK
jgi:hypothetical protein